MSTLLVIDKPEQGISQCTQGPNLMPFNVGYSGPAPITTFFRVQEGDTAGSSDEQMETANHNAEERPSSVDSVAFRQSQEKSVGCFSRHKTATFRGRRIVGLVTDLPKNYSGLVVHGETAGQIRQNRKARKVVVQEQKGKKESLQRARSARKMGEAAAKDTNEQEDGEQELSSVTSDLVRRLHPSEEFSSFTLWNPDIVVDEGQDEYMRTLKEWCALSSEVSVSYLCLDDSQ